MSNKLLGNRLFDKILILLYLNKYWDNDIMLAWGNGIKFANRTRLHLALQVIYTRTEMKKFLIIILFYA